MPAKDVQSLSHALENLISRLYRYTGGTCRLSRPELGTDQRKTHHLDIKPSRLFCPGINHAAEKCYLPFCEARSSHGTLIFVNSFNK